MVVIKSMFLSGHQGGTGTFIPLSRFNLRTDNLTGIPANSTLVIITSPRYNLIDIDIEKYGSTGNYTFTNIYDRPYYYYLSEDDNQWTAASFATGTSEPETLVFQIHDDSTADATSQSKLTLYTESKITFDFNLI